MALAAGVARRSQVDVRTLRARALLHLPRIADRAGTVQESAVRNELWWLAAQLTEDDRRVQGHLPRGTWDLRRLRFAAVPASVAGPIIEAQHYLRSARRDAEHFALLDPVDDLPHAICSVSPMEWRRVGNRIWNQAGIAPNRVRNISRVYSHVSAPPNAVSYLLARVRTALRRSEAGVDLLTTVVDPNVGFSGVSYRATGWQHWVSVQPRPYLYHNRAYVSPRQLRERFGMSDISALRKAHPHQKFELSRVRLRESYVFAWRVRGNTEFIPETARRPIHR